MANILKVFFFFFGGGQNSFKWPIQFSLITELEGRSQSGGWLGEIPISRKTTASNYEMSSKSLILYLQIATTDTSSVHLARAKELGSRALDKAFLVYFSRLMRT